MRGMKVIIEKAETEEDELTPESTARIHCNGHDAMEVAEYLHGFININTDSTANTIADNAMGNGFLAYQRIMRHYDPTLADHLLNKVQNIMEGKRADARTFVGQLEIWERDIRTYQARSSEKIPQDWSTNLMLRQLPVKVEVYVLGYLKKAHPTYGGLRTAIIDHFQLTGTSMGMDVSSFERSDEPEPSVAEDGESEGVLSDVGRQGGQRPGF